MRTKSAIEVKYRLDPVLRSISFFYFELFFFLFVYALAREHRLFFLLLFPQYFPTLPRLLIAANMSKDACPSTTLGMPPGA